MGAELSRLLKRPVVISVAGTAVGAALCAGLVWRMSDAAFSATTSNSGNSWQAGQVGLSTGSSTALFDLSATLLKPGDTGMRCITVTYSGNVTGTVKMFEAVPTGSLASYVQMTISRADGSGAVDCSNFGSLANPSVLTTATDLVALNTSAGTYANGLGAWAASTTTTKTYKFVYAVNSAAPNSTQNTGATATFTWQVST